MECTPITNLPLHVLSDILACLDRYHDLSSTIRSHSAFHAAYREHSRSIDARILENRIPANLLPYGHLLLKSLDVQPNNTQSVVEFFALYRDTLIRRTSLPHLPGRRAAFLCRQYTVIEFLGDQYAHYTTCNLGQALCIWVDVPLSPAEKFRVHRALFRHQIHVNALCHQGQEDDNSDWIILDGVHGVLHDALRSNFYGVHAPWVNTQYFCVYEHITRHLELAVITMAFYDVCWASTGESWNHRSIRRYYLPYAFSLGLRFLARVFGGHGYDYWSKYLQPKPAGYNAPAELRALDRTVEYGLPSPRADPTRFIRDADDAYDGLETGPARAWIEARKFEGATDRHLWKVGYVMWDLPGHTFSRRGVFVLGLYRMQARFEEMEPVFYLAYDGGHATVEMRRRIWRLGGRGFYSLGDFSGVKGLNEEDVEQLMTLCLRGDNN